MTRLDIMLVARGLAPTRSRAQDLIRRGFVSVSGAIVTKPGLEVASCADVALSHAAPQFVSRGAEKLVAALDYFQFDPQGRNAADIGASTGGFTEVLLMRGAAHVTAIDVGQGQLHPSLRGNPRVTMREGTDSRSLTAADFVHSINVITADVSFISLEKALPNVLDLATPGAWLVALVKPQFEVGRDYVGKGGIVRDAAASRSAVQRIAAWLETSGWRVSGTMASPIKGGDGNQEFLIGACKPAMGAP